MTTRRIFLTALCGAALASSVRCWAQQQHKVWRVGFLAPGRRPASLESHPYSAFAKAMRELGYVEGRNLLIEWRFADGQTERLPEVAAELVRLKVDVLLTSGTPAVRAVQKATITIPIVFANAGDPVASGFVRSLARPGGNITGTSNINVDVSAKHLELLTEIVPKLSGLALLVNPDNALHASVAKSVQLAASKSGASVFSLQARSKHEIETAFSAMSQQSARALIVASDAFFIQQWRQIAELAVKYRMPSITARPEYAEAGGLLSYGQSLADQYRRAAVYVDKIFKGAKPADLPVEQPTKLDFVINQKTARAIGVTVPQSVLLRADKVID